MDGKYNLTTRLVWFTPRLSVQEGSTPLFRACFAGNSEEVRVLLEGGANVNELNDVSLTHLSLVARLRLFIYVM